MEGFLLRVFFFLMASRGGSGQLLGDLCYNPMQGPESHLVSYYCPGFQDHEEARFCCGTCSKPFCCSSQKHSLDPTRCPDFHPATEVTSPTTPAPRVDGRLNILWCFVGILVGTIILWSVCRNYSVLKCPRVCGDHEEEEEEEEEEGETQMEERRSQVSLPPIILTPPSPPRSLDYPPPYSAIDPLASSSGSVTNAPLGMGPTEGAAPAHLRGAEGGSPPRLRGAEGGSPPRLRGAVGGARSRLREAESGARSRLREAEWGDPPPPYPGDPPPYSDIDLFATPSFLPPVSNAPRRKRRAKASGAVRRASAQPAGAVGGAPAEPAGVVGGAQAEPAGAVGGAPAEPAGAVGGAQAEPAGAVGGAPAGAPAQPAGAVGGAPAEPAGAVGGAQAEPAEAVGGAPAEAPAEPAGAVGGAFAM